jgi:hypothetical protein
MINRDDNPVQCALWIEELNEAHEHLGKLIDKLISERDYDESILRVDMGHLMAHLNRAPGTARSSIFLRGSRW